MTRLSSTVSRRIIGGSTANKPTEELRHVATSGATPMLQRAVVVDVIIDPTSLTDDEKQEIAERVNNPEFVDVMPGNSVIARMVSDSQDLGTPVSTILFPFFSSNIMLPIAPGEHISVVFDDPTRNGTLVGYWLARKSEIRTVEDVNYTVADRRFFPNYNPQNLSTNERGRENNSAPEFPNGAGTPSTLTLRVTGANNENPYDGIVAGSKAIPTFTFEPVPRYNKRPGELVLQGKNNSTIILGEDRVGSVTRTEDEAVGQAGSIDLVAGRARKLPASADEEPEETAPRIIENTRNQKEVNKTPYLNGGRTDNPREGDPDFLRDAARILVTMQSQLDKNFGLTEIEFPDNTLEFTQPNDGVDGTLNKSYVVSKADHIRIIARKDDDVDGTILIIREGADDTELGYLHIDTEGKLQLYGPELYLGKATGKEEPYIKWTKYKDSIDNLQDQVNALKSFCNNLATTLQTAFSSQTAIPYAPITAFTTAVPQVVQVNQTLNSSLQNKPSDLSQNVEDAKSTRIFGE